MSDEQPGEGNVPPTQLTGSQAEIVFFPISLREDIGSESTSRVQTIAPQIQAEPDTNRDIDNAGAVRLQGHAVQPIRAGLVGDWVRSGRSRIAQDASVVRQWRDGADVHIRIGGGMKPFQPALRHQRVAVEQHDVPPSCRPYAGVGTGRKTQRPRVTPDADQTAVRQFIQMRDNRGFG